jgi:hypothetical protein
MTKRNVSFLYRDVPPFNEPLMIVSTTNPPHMPVTVTLRQSLPITPHYAICPKTRNFLFELLADRQTDRQKDIAQFRLQDMH